MNQWHHTAPRSPHTELAKKTVDFPELSRCYSETKKENYLQFSGCVRHLDPNRTSVYATKAIRRRRKFEYLITFFAIYQHKGSTTNYNVTGAPFRLAPVPAFWCLHWLYQVWTPHTHTGTTSKRTPPRKHRLGRQIRRTPSPVKEHNYLTVAPKLWRKHANDNFKGR